MTTPTPPTTPDLAQRQAGVASLHQRVITVLTWGWRIGAGLLVLGLALTLVRGEQLPGKALLPNAILADLLAGRAAGVVDLAIILLIATPVVATAVVALGFWQRHDKRYTAITLLVLLVLILSVVVSLR